MKTRHTVRVLLFNTQDELLLFRYRNDPNIHNVGKPPMDTDYWGTVGGGIEEGEDLEQAIRREIEEETGHTGITIGPVVWHRAVDLMFYGDLLHVDEKYVVAHTAGMDISTAGHTQIERKFVAETRWWTLDALEQAGEKILPTILPQHIRALAAGNYPETLLFIDV